MHVLVIESNRDTRDLLHEALSDAGYEVSQAKGFMEALQVSNTHPDIGVVVVDLNARARLSGTEMAGAMRHRLSNGHYIVTSSDWDVLSPACPADMTMLRKPYGKRDLLHAVRRGADHQRIGLAARVPG